MEPQKSSQQGKASLRVDRMEECYVYTCVCVWTCLDYYALLWYFCLSLIEILMAVCMCVCVRACVRTCVWVYTQVFVCNPLSPLMFPDVSLCKIKAQEGFFFFAPTTRWNRKELLVMSWLAQCCHLAASASVKLKNKHQITSLVSPPV